jgi:hypothetical protein
MSDILARLVAYRASHTPSDPDICRLLDEAIYELRRISADLQNLQARVREIEL